MTALNAANQSAVLFLAEAESFLKVQGFMPKTPNLLKSPHPKKHVLHVRQLHQVKNALRQLRQKQPKL